MTEHGQRQVDAAKADGRWANAYAPMRETTHDTVPADLRAAIDANPKAKKMFATLNKLNLFALAFLAGDGARQHREAHRGFDARRRRSLEEGPLLVTGPR